jgi:hypothetical protein
MQGPSFTPPHRYAHVFSVCPLDCVDLPGQQAHIANSLEGIDIQICDPRWAKPRRSTRNVQIDKVGPEHFEAARQLWSVEQLRVFHPGMLFIGFKMFPQRPAFLLFGAQLKMMGCERREPSNQVCKKLAMSLTAS